MLEAARMLRTGTSDLVIFATPDDTVLGPLANILIGGMSDGLADVGLHLLTRRTCADAAFASLWRDLSPAAVVGLEEAGACTPSTSTSRPSTTSPGPHRPST